MGLLLLGVLLSACGAAPVAQNWPGLTLADGTIYAISGLPQQVYMLDAETGAQKGTFMPPGEHGGTVWWSPVGVGGGLAFAGFAESEAGAAALYAFDPETRQVVWQVPAESLILPEPVYEDGVIYFGSSDGRLYAVDAETGSVKPGWPFQAEDAIWGSPLVDGGRVYLAAMDHHVYCLDAESGSEIWKRQVGGAMAAQPTLDAASGVLYVGAFDGQVYALRAESGELMDGFKFQADNWIWSEVLLADEQLYVTSLDGKLYALNAADGSVIPPSYDSSELGGSSESLRAAPQQAGESIIVAAQTGWVASVGNAQRQWAWPTGTPTAEILTTPVVMEGKIYAILMDGQVQALDAERGSPIWSFTPPASD
jgi:outer membrane protein assembly factor BamB